VTNWHPGANKRAAQRGTFFKVSQCPCRGTSPSLPARAAGALGLERILAPEVHFLGCDTMPILSHLCPSGRKVVREIREACGSRPATDQSVDIAHHRVPAFCSFPGRLAVLFVGQPLRFPRPLSPASSAFAVRRCARSLMALNTLLHNVNKFSSISFQKRTRERPLILRGDAYPAFGDPASVSNARSGFAKHFVSPVSIH